MSVPAIQTALQQLQALKSEVTTPRLAVDLNVQPGEVTTHTAATPGSVAGELITSLVRINQLQQTAQTNTQLLQWGDPNTSLNQGMAEKQKVALAFEMVVKLR